ncbi:MAG: M23 family metallopeptidase [Verrucomicrobiaceae bacterium]|nr:M23 family metallopeptidase [Verrucomicrobiaceae bacterium]
MLRYLSLVILAFSCHALNADVVWPTPLDDFALGRNPESFLQPTASGNPTSGAFGDVRNNGYKFHEGIDIRPSKRDKRREALDDIYAALDGKIVCVNQHSGNSGYGKYVVMVHTNEDVQVYSLYAHLAEIDKAVGVGRSFKAGERLGKMGRSAGGYKIPKEQAHLHFEIGLMSSMSFNKWYYGSRKFKEKNRFGNYNGINLTGFDPLDFMYAARAGKVSSMAKYIQGLPTAFVVRVYTNTIPDFVKMYPNLVDNNGSDCGWDIHFTWYGLPQKFERIKNPDIKKRGSGEIEIVKYNPEEIKRKCRVMMVVNRKGQVFVKTTLVETIKKLFP